MTNETDDEIYECDHYPPIPADIAMSIIKQVALGNQYITEACSKMHENGKEWAMKQAVELVFMAYVMHTIGKPDGTLEQAIDEMLELAMHHALPKVLAQVPDGKLGSDMTAETFETLDELINELRGGIGEPAKH